MVIRFAEKYLEELYYRKKCKDKSKRFQPQVVENYIRRVITLSDVSRIEALFTMNSLNYEVLTGDKQGMSSVRINRQYRLEFVVSQEGEPIVTICTITDITNHYK